MLFLFNLGKNIAEASQLICQACGKNAVSISTIKKWFKKFEEDDFDMNDKARSGRLHETKDVALQELLDEDATQFTRVLAKRLQVNQSTIQKRLRAMGKILKIGHWVPHKLIEKNMTERLNTCVSLLARHQRKSFFWQIVTGNGKWIHFDNPYPKRSWVDAGSSTISTPKRNVHCKKVMLCIW